ncbi:hypothetical protein HYQ46_007891 [Verticillium longisporum]|nr:hypothetical protein HYQ46_007891 [Verticillium longisporum]
MLGARATRCQRMNFLSTPGPSVSECPTLEVAGAARCRPQNPVQWAMAPRVGELTPSLDGRKVRCDEEAIRREVRTLKLRHFSRPWEQIRSDRV